MSSRNADDEPARILHRLPVGDQAHDYAYRVEEAQVGVGAIDYRSSQVRVRQLVKDDRNIEVNRRQHRFVAFATAERQVVVCRHVTAVRDLGVVIKLHRGEHEHNVSEVTDRDFFPAQVARAVEAERRHHAFLFCLLDTRLDFLHQLRHECFALLKEIFCLRDPRRLDVAELAHAAEVEAGVDASLACHWADLIPRQPARSEVHNEGEEPNLLTLQGLGVGASEEFH